MSEALEENSEALERVRLGLCMSCGATLAEHELFLAVIECIACRAARPHERRSVRF
jgi:hypothetical protein